MLSSNTKTGTVCFQERDLALLRELFESRIMTAAHVTALHFEGRKEAAKKRLQKLKSAGLLAVRARRVNEPAILFLSRKGLEFLRDTGVLAEYPQFDLPVLEKRARVSDLTINHELAVMDAKAAFHTALSGSPTYSIAEFCTWPRIHQFEMGVLVKPDGFIRIHERTADTGLSEHSFFMEVDRSSETLDVLVSRCQAYVEYYKSGGFAVKHGVSRSAYKDFPFRVLVVLKSAERRNNLAERLLAATPPVLTQVYLTTFAEVLKYPIGASWVRPIDLRDALSETPLGTESGDYVVPYIRNGTRNVLIEQRITKIRLLEG